MHVPDGFIDGPTSLAAACAAATAVAVSLRRVGAADDDRVIPLAGMVSAFVFAMQMLNFPVAGGTSGHLLGGALAAVLVGPWLGMIVVGVVLIVQALVFADGGLSAIGVNIVLMAIVTVAVGYGAFRVVTIAIGRGPRQTVVAAGVGAWASVVASSLVFSALFALGGTVDISLVTLTGAMVGVHTLIGIGEAFITAATVSAIIAVRPDLVYGYKAPPALKPMSASEVVS